MLQLPLKNYLKIKYIFIQSVSEFLIELSFIESEKTHSQKFQVENIRRNE